MSGGFFDYSQYKIEQIEEDLERVIQEAEVDNIHEYSQETIKEFKKALKVLKKAYIYTERLDKLLSGDDGESTFHEKLKRELEE